MLNSCNYSSSPVNRTILTPSPSSLRYPSPNNPRYRPRINHRLWVTWWWEFPFRYFFIKSRKKQNSSRKKPSVRLLPSAAASQSSQSKSRSSGLNNKTKNFCFWLKNMVQTSKPWVLSLRKRAKTNSKYDIRPTSE